MSRFKHLRDRLTRDHEDGYIAVTVIGIMLLLMGTSLMVLGAAKSNIITAREGRNFTESRQAMEDAFADATYKFNVVGSTERARLEANQDTSGTVPPNGEWVYDSTTRTVTATGTVNGTEESMTRAVRGRYVGSQYKDDKGVTVYGIAANGKEVNGANLGGAWSHVLSTATDSTAMGQFVASPASNGKAPEIGLFGQATLTKRSNKDASVISYSNGASVTGGAAHESRSAITARLDTTLLDQRIDDLSPLTCDLGGLLGLLFPGDFGCEIGHFSIPGSGWSPSGLKTLVVKGNLTFLGDLTPLSTGQVHIYVTGDVNFSKIIPTSTQTLKNVFIYAPNGTCRTASSSHRIALSGSLACNKIDLPSNNNQYEYVTPMNDGDHVGRATNSIYFTESSGYADSRSN